MVTSSTLKTVLKQNNKEMVELLIQNNKFPKHMNNDLFKFIVKNKYFYLFTLLDYDVFDIHFNYEYALLNTVKNGNFEVVVFLVENGANIHADNDQAIILSSYYGHFRIFKYLAEKGSDMHANNDNALRHASSNGYYNIVEYILKKGVERYAIDDAFYRACSNGHFNIVKLLFEEGACINTRGWETLNNTILYKHFEIAKFLINNNVDLSSNYPIEQACSNGYFDIVKLLIEKGVNLRDKYNKALWSSVLYNHFEITKYLIRSDIEYFSKNDEARYFVKRFKFVEFYEIFGYYKELITLEKNQIYNHIDSSNVEELIKYKNLYFSNKNYDFFIRSLQMKNKDVIKVIFDKIENKENLIELYKKSDNILENESRSLFYNLFNSQDKISILKNKIENLLEELKI